MGTSCFAAIRTLALVSLAAGLLLAGFGGSASAVTAGERPTWVEGQEWTYKGVFLGPNGFEHTTVYMSVIARDETRLILRSDHRFENAWMIKDTLMSTTSFAIVAAESLFSDGFRTRIWFDPPLRLFAFPLEVGKSWSSDPVFGGIAFVYFSLVLGPTNVVTAAGTFEAYPILQNTMGFPLIAVRSHFPGLGRALLYYSAEVGNIVRYVGYDDNGDVVARFSLTAPTKSSLTGSNGAALDLFRIPLAATIATITFLLLRAAAQNVTRRADLSSPARSRRRRRRLSPS